MNRNTGRWAARGAAAVLLAGGVTTVLAPASEAAVAKACPNPHLTLSAQLDDAARDTMISRYNGVDRFYGTYRAFTVYGGGTYKQFVNHKGSITMKCFTDPPAKDGRETKPEVFYGPGGGGGGGQANNGGARATQPTLVRYQYTGVVTVGSVEKY